MTYSMRGLDRIKATQDTGDAVCVVDLIGEFDAAACRKAGIDVSKLLVSRPDGERQARHILSAVAASGTVALFVVYGSVPEHVLRAARDRVPTGEVCEMLQYN